MVFCKRKDAKSHAKKVCIKAFTTGETGGVCTQLDINE